LPVVCDAAIVVVPLSDEISSKTTIEAFHDSADEMVQSAARAVVPVTMRDTDSPDT
jgi:hypothetical protein